MKKKKEFERFAMQMLTKLQHILLLNDHTPLILETPCESKYAKAESAFHYPYKSITIRYDKNLYEDWMKGKKEQVVSVLAHEMCHVVTDPFYSKAISTYKSSDELENERERLTDHIANVLIKNKLI